VFHLDPIQTASMALHNQWHIFAVGCAGGIAGDVFGILGARHSRPPQYFYRPFFWVCTIFMALSGGGLAVLYGFQQVQAFLVLNIGATAPLFFQSLATAVPKKRKLRVG